MSSDDRRPPADAERTGRSVQEWNRIDRGEIEPEYGELRRNPLDTTDDPHDATVSGAGSEPPD